MKNTCKSIAIALLAIIGLQACGRINDFLNESAAEQVKIFTAKAEAAHNAEEVTAVFEYYKLQELNFLKYKAKYDFDEPLVNFRKGCAPALAKLESDFKVKPEYNKMEKFLIQLAE